MNRKWQRLDPALERRILAVSNSWLQTPYMSGQRARGQGADCVQFVAGVLDELFRKPLSTYVPRLKPDSGVHRVAGGLSAALAFRKGYDSYVVRDGTFEPGDVGLVSLEGGVGSARLGNHLFLCGTTPWTIYHAVRGVGVNVGSVGALQDRILRLYRAKDKEQWK